MITIYSSDTCAPCLTLKTYLDRKGIKYTVKNADIEPYATELLELAGGRMLPTTAIDVDGVTHVVRGLNIPMINNLLS